MGTESVVLVTNLTRKFGDFTAVNEISFEVKKGEVFGFLGANGAGKTTTIRMLCGLLSPSAGEASVLGFNLYHQSEEIKRNIGYMSQKFSLYSDLTVEENIQFFGRVYGLGRQKIQQKMKSLLETLQLEDHACQLTASLPLGWKQRLALGTAILHDPAIVFLDEPTSGVDPAARRNFWQTIYELAKHGKTIFVSTHYMDEAQYCHRVSLMKNGAIAASGSPTDLMAQYQVTNLEEVFFKVMV